MVWLLVAAVIAAAVVFVDRLVAANRRLGQILAEEREHRDDEDAADAHAMEPWGDPS